MSIAELANLILTSTANTLSLRMISTVELTMGLLCSSLPTYSYFFPGFSIPSPPENARGYYIQDGTWGLRPREQGSISTQITGGRTLGPRRSGIAVTDDLSRTTHAHVGGAWVRVPNEDEAALFPVRSSLS